MDLIISVTFLYLPIFLFLYCLTQNLITKLRNLPPTPFVTFPLIGQIHMLQKPLHKTLHALSKKHGPIFRLRIGSRHVLVANSPLSAAQCLTNANDAVLACKHLGYNHAGIVWAPHGDHWRNLLLAPHRIQSLSRIRSTVRDIFKASSHDPGRTIDMRTVLFDMSFNVMTRMILGRRYYGHNEASEFREIIKEMHRVAGKSTWDDFVPILRWFTKAEDECKAVHERRDSFLQDLIEEIRDENGGDLNEHKGKSMIEVLLSLQETDPECYSDEIIKNLTAVLLQAGSDASFATMEWAMALLLNNPSSLNKVQTEIDRHVGPDRPISDSDLSSLPYLQCIIYETLRMYPVAPLLLPHESSQDCTVGGFHVPRGTMLLINAWAVQNDPKIWGDPERFRPERFMTTKEGMFRQELKHVPFGIGKRGCPGEALAMRMIGLGLGSLLQCFDWERVGVDFVDMSEKSAAVLYKAQPLMARCWPRPSMVNVFSQI